MSARPFNIKARTIMQGRKLVDLIPELEKKGIRTNQTELSKALSGIGQQPKHAEIVSVANEIVSNWEQEQART